MHGEIADHGAIDFVAEGAAGPDERAVIEREDGVSAVAERPDDLVRRLLLA